MSLQLVREEIKTLLFNELTQSYLMSLLENISSGVAAVYRAADQLYPTKEIQLPALGQMHHFGVQQAVDTSATSLNIPYRLTPTLPAGAYYPKIKSQSFDIVIKRSTSLKCWKQSNYMQELATLNSSYEGRSDDLFDSTIRPPLEESLFIVLDVYIHDKDTIFCTFLVPSSSLNRIHISIPYHEVMEVSSAMPDQNDVKPVSKIKKTLRDLDDDQQQNVSGI